MKKVTRCHTAFQMWLNTGVYGQFIEVRIPLCPLKTPETMRFREILFAPTYHVK